ncbi:SPOR domain-containing protein [Helicobacter sp. T3_23-1059]
MMDDRNELSEILLGNTRQKSSSGKKSIIIVLMAVAVIVVVAFAMWKFLGANEEKISKSNDGTIDKSIATPFENDFGNLGGIDFDTNAIDDSLLKGLEGIQNPQDTPKPEEAETSSLDMIINRLTGGGQSQPQQPAQQSAQPSTQQPAPQQIPQAQRQALAQQPTTKPQPTAQQPTQPSPPTQNLRPQGSTLGANGSAPTTGFYWQLGSFSKEPKAEFVALVKKYSYRVQKITNKNGLTTTRYLLGPYPSEAQAPSREDVQKIFSESPIRVFIP